MDTKLIGTLAVVLLAVNAALLGTVAGFGTGLLAEPEPVVETIVDISAACASAKARLGRELRDDGLQHQLGECRAAQNPDGSWRTAVDVTGVQRYRGSSIGADPLYRSELGRATCQVGVDLDLDQTSLLLASCY